MTRPSPPIRVASLAVLLALTPIPLAQAGPRNPVHRGGGNHQAAAMHQQQSAMRQQQATVMHQQQATVRQHQSAMRQQQAATVRQQQPLNPTVAGAPAPTASRAQGSTNSTLLGGAAHLSTGAVSGLTNPKYASSRRYSPYRGGSGNRSGGQNNGQLVSALHATMARLNQADHDYQGHRVRAVHELGQAIRSLQPQAKLAGMTNSNTGRPAGAAGNGQGPQMPQAQSDQHLQAARQTLMTIQSRMSVPGGSSSAHQRAGGHVQRAVQELNTALAIR